MLPWWRISSTAPTALTCSQQSVVWPRPTSKCWTMRDHISMYILQILSVSCAQCDPTLWPLGVSWLNAAFTFYRNCPLSFDFSGRRCGYLTACLSTAASVLRCQGLCRMEAMSSSVFDDVDFCRPVIIKATTQRGVLWIDGNKTHDRQLSWIHQGLKGWLKTLKLLTWSHHQDWIPRDVPEKNLTACCPLIVTTIRGPMIVPKSTVHAILHVKVCDDLKETISSKM